ncbi:6-phosphogluconate dehydrogenase NAD-binding [Chthoniobacter flavus Ellin428]|uniref:6-phosphogluconate dehydrogenase NAD-binding n=1 Tax=Chthoniobacter flavus Ellin428 TaxID=497964 RepID=B4D8H2_9BACT|nr:NAD(P)-dependent oxidoreductase [Chthoniobacter flavus]EDY17194.1 6-phosphogluconate dehydrogenase NAD-binding [Chthoniobacter flavus Ellin428]TCO86981.1 2-hydroxy-3-oxopropionate reductase [Chthoniobacter flavus]
MNIAVLGLGIIGSAWAQNLIADGNAVRCWNRTPKEFPHFYKTIAEAIEGAEAIFIVVADPAAVQSVLEEVLPRIGKGQMVVQSSTISAEWTLKFAAQVEKTGATFLEAPLTGSKAAAAKRETVYYLGGSAEVVERAQALLKPISKAILHVGPTGSASTLKLAMNMNIAGIAQTICESLTLCRAAGISDDAYFAALGRNAAHSPLADLKEPKLREQDYSPQFSLKHMAKDLRLAMETAGKMSLTLAQTALLKQSYERGMEAGWKEDDFIGLIRLLEEE